VERTLEVRTGESIAIRYELAGLGSRFLAVGLDLAIQIGVTLAILIAALLLAKPLNVATASVPANLTKTGEAVLIGAGVLAIFCLYFGYFIVFELWWSGRTPGKRALGIRVLRDAGFPIDVGAATVRNLVRVLEFGLGFYALSAVSAVLSPQNKRLGDFAAGTVVVRDRRYETADIDAYLARDVPDDDGLSAAERSLVERYVARRDQLEPNSRVALAAQIAGRVRPRLRASFDYLDDDALLQHLGRGAKPPPRGGGQP
jgi:uncharacterized RDD family membrane protein YckC